MYHSMLRALLTVLFALPFAAGSVSAQVPERVTFLHHDAFGSLVAATDAQGQIVWTGSPEPFGAVDDPNAAPRFVDQPQAAAGLFQLGARVYDPFTGRFLSPDPQSLAEVDLTNPQRLNRYTYGLNNPYRYQDATGEVPVETVLDIIDIGMSAYDLYNEPSWLNAGMVAWSVAAVFVPYVPGAWVAKAGKAGGVLADAAKGSGRAASNPRVGRLDAEHVGSRGFDSAREGAFRNAGDLGANTQKMIDPATGTLIGEMSINRKRGWRIDNDHFNWWDWTGGKKGQGGKYGHEFFPSEQAGPHSMYIGYADWE